MCKSSADCRLMLSISLPHFTSAVVSDGLFKQSLNWPLLPGHCGPVRAPAGQPTTVSLLRLAVNIGYSANMSYHTSADSTTLELAATTCCSNLTLFRISCVIKLQLICFGCSYTCFAFEIPRSSPYCSLLLFNLLLHNEDQ